MKKIIIAASGTLLALALVSTTLLTGSGCATTSGGTSNTLTNPIVGTNGVLTLALNTGVSFGSAYVISQALDRSPQHAAEIKADLSLILGALQALQGTGTITGTQVTTVLANLKLGSTEAKLFAPQITIMLNDAFTTLSAQGVSTTPYVPKLLNSLIMGIQTGMGFETSLSKIGT